ncbi:hypothetical protein Tco_0634520 [Tanacetum coccineum]
MFRIMLGTQRELFELRLLDLLQMFNATIAVRKDEAGVTLTNEQNDFLVVDATQMEDIEELNLEEKAKDNENVVLKIDRSLQAMFMLGPKPMSFYDPNLKHGLGYKNPYTLKKAVSQNLKIYDASCFGDTKNHVNVRYTEDILDDATKSQMKMENKLKDPIVIEKK